MPKKIPAMQGAMATLGLMADIAMGRDVPGRDDILNDQWDGITVDTCCAFDTGAWETGVMRSVGEEHWDIVEQYDDRDAAVIGHAKWVALLKADRNAELSKAEIWDGL
jgi:hypothetical protein